MTRLQVLKNRRERLIRLNGINHYTQTGNCKIEKYYRILLSIKKQINDIECINVRPEKVKIVLMVRDLFELKKIWQKQEF